MLIQALSIQKLIQHVQGVICLGFVEPNSRGPRSPIQGLLGAGIYRGLIEGWPIEGLIEAGPISPTD